MRSSNKLGLVIASIALVVIVACGGGAEEDPAAETVAVAVAPPVLLVPSVPIALAVLKFNQID
jgi:hypothetical protein